MSKNLKKHKYFHVDAGFFPVEIKLCFNDDEFQQILKDYGIKQKVSALDVGCAETHYFQDAKIGVIIMVFDLSDIGTTNAEIAGVVAHEATHCVARIAEHVGEPDNDMGEETVAYLTEHITKQIWQGIEIRKERNAREGHRKVPKQKGKGVGRTDIQVALNNNGSARPDSNPQQKDIFCGAENPCGSSLGAPKTGFLGARGAWANSDYYPK